MTKEPLQIDSLTLAILRSGFELNMPLELKNNMVISKSGTIYISFNLKYI